MRRLRVLSAATGEAEEASDWYEQKEPGLGNRFRLAYGDALAALRQEPLTFEPITRHLRQCRTVGFPYGVIYQVDVDEIVVIAVTHLSRRPGYWRDCL